MQGKRVVAKHALMVNCRLSRGHARLPFRANSNAVDRLLGPVLSETGLTGGFPLPVAGVARAGHLGVICREVLKWKCDRARLLFCFFQAHRLKRVEICPLLLLTGRGPTCAHMD